MHRTLLVLAVLLAGCLGADRGTSVKDPNWPGAPEACSRAFASISDGGVHLPADRRFQLVAEVEEPFARFYLTGPWVVWEAAFGDGSRLEITNLAMDLEGGDQRVLSSCASHDADCGPWSLGVPGPESILYQRNDCATKESAWIHWSIDSDQGVPIAGLPEEADEAFDVLATDGAWGVFQSRHESGDPKLLAWDFRDGRAGNIPGPPSYDDTQPWNDFLLHEGRLYDLRPGESSQTLHETDLGSGARRTLAQLPSSHVRFCGIVDDIVFLAGRASLQTILSTVHLGSGATRHSSHEGSLSDCAALEQGTFVSVNDDRPASVLYRVGQDDLWHPIISTHEDDGGLMGAAPLVAGSSGRLVVYMWGLGENSYPPGLYWADADDL